MFFNIILMMYVFKLNRNVLELCDVFWFCISLLLNNYSVVMFKEILMLFINKILIFVFFNSLEILWGWL